MKFSSDTWLSEAKRRRIFSFFKEKKMCVRATIMQISVWALFFLRHPWSTSLGGIQACSVCSFSGTMPFFSFESPLPLDTCPKRVPTSCFAITVLCSALCSSHQLFHSVSFPNYEGVGASAQIWKHHEPINQSSFPSWQQVVPQQLSITTHPSQHVLALPLFQIRHSLKASHFIHWCHTHYLACAHWIQ